MKNVIFIDAESVLTTKKYKINHNNCGFNTSYIDTKSLDVLERICTLTDSSLVVIDSMGLNYSNGAPCSKFSHDLNLQLELRNIKFEGHTTPLRIRNKGLEVLSYVEDHNIENYMLIDDSLYGDFPREVESHILQVPYNDGLGDIDIERGLIKFVSSNDIPSPYVKKISYYSTFQ